MNDLADHARRLRFLPPSCGPVRLIAVDGHAGSGKSTFADRLAAALGDTPVLRLDDLATHEELFAWTDRLRAQVLAPLSRGEPARYAPYDWTARRFGPPRTLDPAPVILIEGVGAGRAAVRPFLAGLLWIEGESEASWEQGRLRDGPGLSDFWDGWTVAEHRHFADDPSYPFADAVIRRMPTGYTWLDGPHPTAVTSQIVTDS
ncbi:uridine kinase [Streptomyces sp. NPDC091271]|uniref:uridine kinase family protein n=1 Tax=Streptomyces sp. NPDC091271 TaxID=3365980 RepID=UPI00380E62E3